MTSSLRRSAALILAAFVVAGPAAVPAAAGEADLDLVAAGHGVSADELLDAVPYPPGAERAEVKAAREDKAERDRARAVATEFAADDDDDDADGDETATRPKPRPAHDAQVAAAFSVEPAQVLALRDEGVGWGAIVKLHQIAHARDVPVGEVLAGIPHVDGEYQFDFGELRQQLSDEERTRMMEKPRSVGAIRSKRPDHAGPKPKAERDAAKAERKAERDAAKAAGDDEDDGDDELDGGHEDEDDDAKGPKGERGKPDKPGKDRDEGPDDADDEDDGGDEGDDDEDD